jgi:hypothetical protein
MLLKENETWKIQIFHFWLLRQMKKKGISILTFLLEAMYKPGADNGGNLFPFSMQKVRI